MHLPFGPDGGADRPTSSRSIAGRGDPAASDRLGEPLHSLLQRRLIDLERRLAGLVEAVAPPADAPSLPRPERALLHEVRAALSRLERGNFGRCLACDRPIDLARLLERPQQRWCPACAEQAAAS